MRFWSPLAPLALVLAAFALILDQAFKWWMLTSLDIANRQPVAVTSFFELVLSQNRGISYGFLKTPDQWMLIAVSAGVSLILWVWACRSLAVLTVAALGLIIGGAVSNALDRLLHGWVADFFHFHLGAFSWYVFNFADVAIVAGVAALLYESVFERTASGSHGNA